MFSLIWKHFVSAGHV